MCGGGRVGGASSTLLAGWLAESPASSVGGTKSSRRAPRCERQGEGRRASWVLQRSPARRRRWRRASPPPPRSAHMPSSASPIAITGTRFRCGCLASSGCIATPRGGMAAPHSPPGPLSASLWGAGCNSTACGACKAAELASQGGVLAGGRAARRSPPSARLPSHPPATLPPSTHTGGHVQAAAAELAEACRACTAAACRLARTSTGRAPCGRHTSRHRKESAIAARRSGSAVHVASDVWMRSS